MPASLMAALNVLPSLPSCSQPSPFSAPRRLSSASRPVCPLSRHQNHPPPPERPQKPLESIVSPPPAPGEGLRAAGAVALLAASLWLADPAAAFKGGGPYGVGVTRGQDLTGKDFSGKTLIKQDFKTSILRQTNFKGAQLVGASFFDADLTGADLSDADLRGVDLSLANVTKANLTNANLEGALATGNTSFRGSIINGADFTDVPLRDDQREYLCKVADGVNPATGNATRDTLFCK